MAADKVAILGAGSVGCLIGGAWQAAGVSVSFIGRPRIAEDIARHGLTISDFSGWQRHFAPGEVDYATQADRLSEANIVAVCVKSGATADAAREILDHGADGSLVISFQNGVSNVDVLKRELGDRFEVVRGMVPYNCAYLGDGRFHKGVAGDLYAEMAPSPAGFPARSAGPDSKPMEPTSLPIATEAFVDELFVTGQVDYNDYGARGFKSYGRRRSKTHELVRTDGGLTLQRRLFH